MTEEMTGKRSETEYERIDRNLEELMAEMRVALPGIQVLFAFLLILPFNSRFDQVTPLQEKVYLGTLIATALSAVLLIGPTLHHRLQFRADRKERILAHSHRLSLVGLALLALAMGGAVFLVTDFVFNHTVAALSTAVLALTVAAAWYVLPYVHGRPPRS